MSLNRKISLVQLQEDVHDALKAWNQYGLKESAIGHLYLFRKRYFNGANPWHATNNILLAAFNRLEEQDPNQAILLRQRFLDRHSPEVVAEEFEMAQSTLFTLQNYLQIFTFCYAISLCFS